MTQPSIKHIAANHGVEVDTLIVEDRSLALGFIQLPKLILHARNLSRDAKLLYAILLGYAWQEHRCFPGYRRLCQDMQASENMVRKYMRELEALGLLAQKRRGLGKTNIYTLCDLRTSKIAVQEPPETAVAEPFKTAAKIEASDKDVNPRNSKGNSDEDKTKNTREGDGEEEADHTSAQPINPYRSASSRRRSHSVTALGDVLADVGQSLLQRYAPKATAPDQHHSASTLPEQIAVCVKEISHELGDARHERANLSQALNLFNQSRLDPSSFVSRLYEAKAVTRDRQRTSRSISSAAPVLRPMAYFWTIVRDQLGLTMHTSEPATVPDAVEVSGRQGSDPRRASHPTSVQTPLSSPPTMSPTHISTASSPSSNSAPLSKPGEDGPNRPPQNIRTNQIHEQEYYPPSQASTVEMVVDLISTPANVLEPSSYSKKQGIGKQGGG